MFKGANSKIRWLALLGRKRKQCETNYQRGEPNFLLRKLEVSVGEVRMCKSEGGGRSKDVIADSSLRKEARIK